MDWKKINLRGSRMLNVVYTSHDGDVINMAGANIVHKDLREAMRALIPHMVLLAEQPESMCMTLEDLREELDKEKDNRLVGYSVNGITFKDGSIMISGSRMLKRGDFLSVQTPIISLVDDDKYEHLEELSLDIENVKYEAEEYVTNRKWGLKEGTLDFDEAGDPFTEGMEADTPPTVTVDITSGEDVKKKKRKSKKTLKAS